MLYVVPTPLGNLEDMPPRGLRALKESSAVYCEDTRRTRALMSHFGLSTPLERYSEHDDRSAERLLARLTGGSNIALVSDGGMPGVSDPGRRIVAMARSAGVPVTVVPGPSAVAAAIAGSGLPGDSFVFLGFLPRTPGKRRKMLAEAAALGRTMVIYESPQRVADLLNDAEQTLGTDAQACLVRELSKVHEEWLNGSVGELRRGIERRGEILGECVVVLHPSRKSDHDTDS